MRKLYKTASILLVALLYPVTGQGGAAVAQQSQGSTIVIDHEILYKFGASFKDLPDRVGSNDQSSEGVFGELRLQSTVGLWENWQLYSDLRAFGATSAIAQDSDDDLETGRTVRTSDSDSFLQLRQFRLRYNGLTNYPEEYLSLGLQQLRAHSSLFWDGYMESMLWNFSTTRFSFQAGAGERFDTYRSNTELSNLEKDKTRIFSELSYDWRAYQELIFTIMYAEQSNGELTNSIYSGAPDGMNGEWLWYGVGLSSNWLQRRHPSKFAYNLLFSGLEGSSNFLSEGEEFLADHDISAWAFDSGVRFDFSSRPFSAGMTFTQGSGGFDADESQMYVQTGLHTNRESYTGNNLYMYRFNEALRPDLTNLRHYSAFASCTLAEQYLLSTSVAGIERVETNLPIYRLGKPLDLDNDSRDVGWGLDIAYRHRLDTKIFHIPVTYYGMRQSTFFPGDAFGDDADSADYSVMFEISGAF